MLVEALIHLVRGIVDDADAVAVTERSHGSVLDVRVAPDDLGRVIGRAGRTAGALRTVIDALAESQHVRVNIVDTDH